MRVRLIHSLQFLLVRFGAGTKEGENVGGHCHIGQCLHLLVPGITRYIAMSAISGIPSLTYTLQYMRIHLISIPSCEGYKHPPTTHYKAWVANKIKGILYTPWPNPNPSKNGLLSWVVPISQWLGLVFIKFRDFLVGFEALLSPKRYPSMPWPSQEKEWAACRVFEVR